MIQLNPAYLTQSGREQVNATHDAPWHNFEGPLVLSIHTIEGVLQNCINVRCDTDM